MLAAQFKAFDSFAERSSGTSADGSTAALSSRLHSAHDASSVASANLAAKLPSFTLPAVANPVAFAHAHIDTASTPGHGSKRLKLNHGTTTLAFRYQGGLLLAVDCRATAGSIIASQTVKKVVEITPSILATIAGGAADCQFWERKLAMNCRLHELRNKERIAPSGASKMLFNMVSQYKGMGLSMGTMIVGWNYKKGESELYYVDSDGERLPGDCFSVGSGSMFAYGVLDRGYRWDLTKEEAVDLGRRAIFQATFRDAYSGGFVRVYHIDESGWNALSIDDVGDLHYEYEEEKLVQAQTRMQL
ncbi:proteasome-domain-containing protein [Ramicandelaber brevisporus]|nr:proteasome-domain-containing protein [Ramicandelaber brevisporus]